MPSRARLIAALLTALVAVNSRTAAGQLPDKFENLKVLPKDISKDSLVQVMRGFALGLGVRCTYCHVAEEKPANAPADAPEKLIFKSDDKVQKRKARIMMHMVDSINHRLLVNLPERHDPAVMVRCATCHRSSPLPQTLDMVLTETVSKSGIDSAVAQYRDLRGHMQSGRYDFDEWSLTETARELAGSGKPDAAIAMLKLNQEYFPQSPDIDFQLAELYLKAGAKDTAIARYRAVLAKRPQDVRARKRLEELGGV